MAQDIPAHLSEEDEKYRYEDDEEDEESDEEDEPEEIALPNPKENAIYNTDAIRGGMDSIAWTEKEDWFQTLSVTHADSSVEEVDVNDDLARELAFYTQAMEGAKEALIRLHERGVPIIRPTDYYAEMVKSDSHMLKVKGQLLAEKRRLEEMEERRKQRESKKYSKEVQSEKLKERAKQKKSEVEAVKNWRKERKKSGFSEEGADEFPIDLENDNENTKSKKKNKPMAQDRSLPKAGGSTNVASRKRKMKDEKYGFGGGKRIKKQNNFDSAGEMTGFKGNRKDKSFEPSGKGRKNAGKGKKKPQRPGKNRRKNEKSRR